MKNETKKLSLRILYKTGKAAELLKQLKLRKMKSQIRITGQISGNFELLRKMSNYTERKDGMFNSFILTYNSVKDARLGIRNAYKSLISDEPDMKGKFGGVRKSKDNSSLYYDASQANIEKI